MMNTSFNFLKIVNTYGAFGSVTKTRHEVILLGTQNNTIDDQTVWLEYQFKCKPGDITRRPCIISPYHYRLDWLMWFAAFQNYNQNPWLLHLIAKLLVNDPIATSLIAFNPFENTTPPKFMRADLYRYRMPIPGSKEAKEGAWWNRQYVKEYIPVVNLASLMKPN